MAGFHLDWLNWVFRPIRRGKTLPTYLDTLRSDFHSEEESKCKQENEDYGTRYNHHALQTQCIRARVKELNDVCPNFLSRNREKIFKVSGPPFVLWHIPSRPASGCQTPGLRRLLPPTSTPYISTIACWPGVPSLPLTPASPLSTPPANNSHNAVRRLTRAPSCEQQPMMR